jgi:hypothetical protein
MRRAREALTTTSSKAFETQDRSENAIHFLLSPRVRKDGRQRDLARSDRDPADRFPSALTARREEVLAGALRAGKRKLSVSLLRRSSSEHILPVRRPVRRRFRDAGPPARRPALPSFVLSEANPRASAPRACPSGAQTCASTSSRLGAADTQPELPDCSPFGDPPRARARP